MLQFDLDAMSDRMKTMDAAISNPTATHGELVESFEKALDTFVRLQSFVEDGFVVFVTIFGLITVIVAATVAIVLDHLFPFKAFLHLTTVSLVKYARWVLRTALRVGGMRLE